MLRLHKALLNFSLKCYPGDLGHINHCVSQVAGALKGKTNLDENAIAEIEALLSIPLR